MIGPAYRVAIAVVVLDQLSKSLAHALLPSGGVTPLLPGLLQLRVVFNTGAAFSVLEGNAGALGLVSALVAIALVFWIQTSGPMQRLQWAALGLLLGGALGNGIDRWHQGRVLDFLEIVPIHFPVFNLADVAINLAVVCLVLDLLQRHGQQAR